MWQWISSNYHFLSLLANFGMLIVWVFYLQLFIGSFNRQRRTKILINRGTVQRMVQSGRSTFFCPSCQG